MRHRAIPAPRDDAGSVSVFAVVAVTVLVMFVGIAVDLSGAIHTSQRAHDLARQAARAGAQAAQANSVVQGGSPQVDSTRAVQAAKAYLRASGVDGTVSSGQARVAVTVTDTYHPVLLGLIGLNTMTLQASSDAALVRGLAGASR